MSRHRKLLDKIIAKPKDFTWDELKTLLNGFGYREEPGGKTAGSRMRFVHERRGPIILHKPHPGSELKSYQVSQIVTHLKVEGLI